MAEAGITVLADRAGRQSLQLAGVPPENLASLSSQTPPELAVVFGGDGNILRAAEWAVPRQVPVLGVNLGHVGFLAELESADIIELIERVIEKDYKVERRQTVDATVFDAEGAQVWHSFAVNECSIEKNARERMIEVLVRIDSRPLSRWATDGVLVATPTGSTAYAFSAHGPVVWPGVKAQLLVPLSAHALFARPMVLGRDTVVDVEILPAAAGVVWCDGRRTFDLVPGMRVHTKVGAHELLLARTSEQPFVTRLVRKFGLPVDGWRGGA
jgi:NAD+ kinase